MSSSNINNIPQALHDLNQWVVWKKDKKPRNARTGTLASVANPSTWSTFQEACDAVQKKKASGVGFVFTNDDPYVGIDLDHVIDDDGQITPYAQDIIDRFDSYTEISQSGHGIHIIIWGKKPKGDCKTKGIEVYDQGRYFALTSNIYQGRDTIQERQGELNSLFIETFGGSNEPTPEPQGEPIQEGQRNSTLLSLAGSMRRPGMTENEMLAALLVVNRERCQPPLEDKQVAKVAKSVSRYEPETTDRLALIELADIESKEVEWLWYPYIPLGKLTLMDGDPGEGKSWFALAIAARVSLGELGRKSANVIVASLEDDEPDAIKPRLEGLDADMKCISSIDKDSPFTLDKKGLQMLEDLVKQKRPELLIFDPILGYMASDINRANEMRAITSQLRRIASDNKCAILGIRHMTKPGKGLSTKAIYRGLGSIDLIAAARSGLLVGHSEDEDGNMKERGMIHIKSNYAPYGDPIGFEIINYGWGGCFNWIDSTITAGDILGRAKEGSKVDKAMALLRDILADGEAVLATDIYEAGKAEGISDRTMRTAKKRIKAKSGGKDGGKWHWVLPKDGKPVDLEPSVKMDNGHIKVNLDEI